MCVWEYCWKCKQAYFVYSMTVIRLGWKVVNYLMLIKNVVLITTGKGVSELRVSALVCLSAIEKKSVYWSSSLESLRILNVQDIIKERTKETSSNISSTCIPSTTIAGAGQHLFNTCLRCTSYRGCRPTHKIPVQCRASIAAHCWFNAGQSSTTLAQH